MILDNDDNNKTVAVAVAVDQIPNSKYFILI